MDYLHPAAQSLSELLDYGRWAAESLHLLHRAAEAFAEPVSSRRSRLEVPRKAFGARIVVSVDPEEDRFHGHGLPAFTSHFWQREGFEVLPGELWTKGLKAWMW